MMDRKKLLLLYNPSAGRAQTSRNLDMLLQKFCTGGCETTVYPILDGLNAEDILAGAESAGYDIVVCCGGDGTLHHTVNGLLRLEQPPLLGYIPSGSTNDFAASLGLPKTPEDAADAVRWAYAADLLTEKDGKLHVADELTRKELTRMLEDFLDLI